MFAIKKAKVTTFMSYSLSQLLQRNKFISNFVPVASHLEKFANSLISARNLKILVLWNKIIVLFVKLFVRGEIFVLFRAVRDSGKSLAKTWQSYKRRPMASLQRKFSNIIKPLKGSTNCHFYGTLKLIKQTFREKFEHLEVLVW